MSRKDVYEQLLLLGLVILWFSVIAGILVIFQEVTW